MNYVQPLNFQPNYSGDQMAVLKNTTFLADPSFQRGYNRACRAGGGDWGIHWRFHTCLWAAKNAMSLEGDFVECGVGKGFNSSGIMEALNWNSLDRQFYLFDTFSGVVEELCTEAEKAQMLNEWGGVDAHNRGWRLIMPKVSSPSREIFPNGKTLTLCAALFLPRCAT